MIGYSDSDVLSIDKMCDFLDLRNLRNNSVVIFDDSYSLLKTDIREIAEKKDVVFTNNSITDYLSDYSLENNEEYQEVGHEFLKFYINNKVASIKKSAIDIFTQYSSLLNVDDITAIQVPPYLVKNYFYTFLKQVLIYLNGMVLQMVLM